NGFNSNVDGLEVVQGDEVTFRIDVTAPQVDTTDVIVWDALPVGVTSADIVGVDGSGWISSPNARVATVTGPTAVETELPGAAWRARVLDFGDADYPSSSLRADVLAAQRSIIVWEVFGIVPGSIPASGTD